jgi:hypothetical protein
LSGYHVSTKPCGLAAQKIAGCGHCFAAFGRSLMNSNVATNEGWRVYAYHTARKMASRIAVVASLSLACTAFWGSVSFAQSSYEPRAGETNKQYRARFWREAGIIAGSKVKKTPPTHTHLFPGHTKAPKKYEGDLHRRQIKPGPCPLWGPWQVCK